MRLDKVREYLKENDIQGWLIYDFQGLNPIFREAIGQDVITTRRCFYFIDQDESILPKLLVHMVDTHQFDSEGTDIISYRNRHDLKSSMKEILKGRTRCSQQEMERICATLLDQRIGGHIHE